MDKLSLFSSVNLVGDSITSGTLRERSDGLLLSFDLIFDVMLSGFYRQKLSLHCQTFVIT